MANRIASLITFLRAVVDAFRTQQAQIGELQQRVTALEGHAETVTGVTGITTDLDASTITDLQDQLAAAMPAPADSAPEAASPAPAAEQQPAAEQHAA